MQSWYDCQNDAVRGRHDTVIRFLLGQEVWRRPYAEKLVECDGLIEIIIKTKVQHRLFGFYGIEKGDFTVVLPCTHRGKIYTPREAKREAICRMNEVKQGKVKAIYCDQPRKPYAISK
jgi:hypothetical protein